jgi:hypothetical protein
MRSRLLLTAIATSAFLAVPLGASGAPPDAAKATSTYTYTKNMHPLGYSANLYPNTPDFDGWNSDLAFWGKTAYQGTIEGFRILDVSSPAKPREVIDYTDCAGDQGDVIIWRNILVRSWNSPAEAGATCDGVPVPVGQEGLHVFDVSNPRNPQVLTFVALRCGSHTATAAPDPANGVLYVYNSPSDEACPGFDVVRVPLPNPAGASRVREVVSMMMCHDIGVILGAVNKLACAGHFGLQVFGIGGSAGGSKANPQFLWAEDYPGVTIGHSAAWTWDGRFIILGHEPGGGIEAHCQATSAVTDRTLYIVNAATGAVAGTFVHPRPQTAQENCSWHNFNVVPTSKRYVLVSGNYQSGVSVVDFTNPANAYEFAFADPAPLPCCTEAFGLPLTLGGDWSSYWYNGRIYESDITRGLIVWKLSDPHVAGAMRLSHLNPQTQEFSFEYRFRPTVGKAGKAQRARGRG